MKKVKNKKRYIVLIAILLLMTIVFGYMATGNYHADFDLSIIKQENPSIVISEKSDYIKLSDGNVNDYALLFYPGGKVDYDAYIPFLSNIAINGCDVYLIKMPFNLAVFGVNRGDLILYSSLSYNHVYMAGHSLGGVMANRYALENKDLIDGVIYYASYPDKEMAENQKSLLIYGSLDNVLDFEAVESNRINLSKNYVELIIPGGNHYNFGNYGIQKGDNLPAISRETQQKTAAEATVEFIFNN
ncbi:MAG: alpha/beta hydrolase [Clostridia bacterium]|nr:alpha/beta hydrolase [Clostridia bacterium]